MSEASAVAARGEPRGQRPRFRFFVIDSGWDSAAARVMRANLEMIARFQEGDPLFVLTQEQSTDLIRRNPQFLGKDPILLARDLGAANREGRSEYHGFHLNLGLIKHADEALAVLKEFLAFLATHRDSPDIEGEVRGRLHRDGLKGAVEIVRSGEGVRSEG
jgi:hypothetical protein